MFPWLSDTANRYEKYKFLSLHFSYRPMVSTSTGGVFVMSMDYDPDDVHESIADSESRISMMSRPDSVSCSAWDTIELHVPETRLREVGERFVKNKSGENLSIEPRTSHLGILYFGVFGASAGSQLYGDLIVHYTIQLRYPQLADIRENTESRSTAVYRPVSTLGSLSLEIDPTNIPACTSYASVEGIDYCDDDLPKLVRVVRGYPQPSDGEVFYVQDNFTGTIKIEGTAYPSGDIPIANFDLINLPLRERLRFRSPTSSYVDNLAAKDMSVTSWRELLSTRYTSTIGYFVASMRDVILVAGSFVKGQAFRIAREMVNTALNVAWRSVSVTVMNSLTGNLNRELRAMSRVRLLKPQPPLLTGIPDTRVERAKAYQPLDDRDGGSGLTTLRERTPCKPIVEVKPRTW